MTFESINPATGELLETYAEHSDAELQRLVEDSWAAFAELKALGLDRRTALLRATAQALREESENLALTLTREMGKPIREARAEVEKSATACDYYASRATDLLKPRAIEHGQLDTWVEFQPVGPIVAVMPWNYPVWQVVRAAAPAMAVGNTLIVKHAANVTGSAYLLEEVYRRAGWPEHAFRLAVTGPEGVEKLVSAPEVRGVTLTGGTRAGEAIGRLAGANLKKSVLELGGSDAFIVFDDADVPRAVEAAVSGRFLNAGQSCIAAKRILVQESVADEFEEAFVARVQKLTLGDPLDDATDVGPMARADQRDDLLAIVHESVRQGARLATGGQAAPVGAYLEPTVLLGVTPGMPVFAQETFGPVAAVHRFDSDEEAIDVANRSEIGRAHV